MPEAAERYSPTLFPATSDQLAEVNRLHWVIVQRVIFHVSHCIFQLLTPASRNSSDKEVREDIVVCAWPLAVAGDRGRPELRRGPGGVEGVSVGGLFGA